MLTSVTSDVRHLDCTKGTAGRRSYLTKVSLFSLRDSL